MRAYVRKTINGVLDEFSGKGTDSIILLLFFFVIQVAYFLSCVINSLILIGYSIYFHDNRSLVMLIGSALSFIISKFFLAINNRTGKRIMG